MLINCKSFNYRDFHSEYCLSRCPSREDSCGRKRAGNRYSRGSATNVYFVCVCSANAS
jgi:hypothetical protein